MIVYISFFWPALRVGVVGFARPGFRAGWPTPGGVLGGRGGPGTPPGGGTPRKHTPPYFWGVGGRRAPLPRGSPSNFFAIFAKIDLLIVR